MWKDSSMTTEKCIAHCKNNGFQYAGTEYGNECHCGRNLPPLVKKKPSSECKFSCKGNAKQKCGGIWRISVYKI